MGRYAIGTLLGTLALVLLTGASAPIEQTARIEPQSDAGGALLEALDVEALVPSGTSPESPSLLTDPAGFEAKTSRSPRAKGPVAARGPCPADMTMIAGASCPDVEQQCLEWLPELPGSPPRCARFAPNAVCRAATTPLKFCIDRFEYPNREGQIPIVNIDWDKASALCAARGRRLCKSREWTLACEGEARLPYPYGYSRDESACNVDRPVLGPFPRRVPNVPKAFGRMPLVDWRVASGEMERCVSPFGVHDMTGNVDEWVVNESGKPYPSGLKGGYWGPVRDRCRPMTVAHDQKFSFYQIGFRCCADTAP